MQNETYYQKMFFIGAVWNWVGTLTGAIGYKVTFAQFGMALPRYPVFFLLFLGLAFVFGLGYYWVSRDIHLNHGIVKMGIIGKIMVFVLLLWAGLTREINMAFIVPGAVDLVFSILFIEFLLQYKKTGDSLT